MEDAEIPNENIRLYVIGNIHGRLDLLARVIAAIARDVKEHGSDALTVTLGDYIDRGPASCGVIGRLSDNPFPTPYVALKGDHEVLLEDFLADPTVGPHWWRLGGIETLHSYGAPGLPLERQHDKDLLWIRDEFLNSKMDFGKIVVHGHTPTAEPEVPAHRINIDTGAFATGRLICVVLDEGAIAFSTSGRINGRSQRRPALTGVDR